MYDPTVLRWLALSGLVLGTVLSWFPLWKSATLSPDSIRRRVYWIGCGVAVLAMFLSAVPDWPSAVFASGATALALVVLAWRWTNHLKINGRVWAASAADRRPDRPPALAGDRRVDDAE